MFPLSVFLFCLLLNAAFPGPVPNSIEEEDKIDLSSLGESIYGAPSNKTGEILAAYDPSKTKQYPEELGEYAQGDILFPTDGSRNGLRAESSRWPNAIIPYIIEGHYSAEHRDNIMKAIADYHRHTCIRFVAYKGEADYITINNRKTGCWSSVGKIGGRQDVNLQNPGCVTTIGTIIHELMHAAGFLHEQSRNDRDKYVSIQFQNIRRGEEHNFDKASKDSTDDFGVAYDLPSVMHYGEYAFSANNQPTIISKISGAKMGQREGLSRSDIKKLRAMYKCDNPQSDAPRGSSWTDILG